MASRGVDGREHDSGRRSYGCGRVWRQRHAAASVGRGSTHDKASSGGDTRQGARRRWPQEVAWCRAEQMVAAAGAQERGEGEGSVRVDLMAAINLHKSQILKDR